MRVLKLCGVNTMLCELIKAAGELWRGTKGVQEDIHKNTWLPNNFRYSVSGHFCNYGCRIMKETLGDLLQQDPGISIQRQRQYGDIAGGTVSSHCASTSKSSSLASFQQTLQLPRSNVTLPTASWCRGYKSQNPLLNFEGSSPFSPVP